MTHFTVFALTTLVASQLLAVPLTLDCGKSMNTPRSIKITAKSPGQDGYELAATFKTVGPDRRTGQLSSVTYRLVGQRDLSTLFSGETGVEESVYAFLDFNNPNIQLVVKQPTAGQTSDIRAAQINLSSQSLTEMNCSIK